MMKVLCKILFSLLLAWMIPAFGEIAPYLMPRQEVALRNFIKSDQVQLDTASGKLRPSDYIQTISLDGTWKIHGMELSSKPFPADVDLSEGFQSEAFDDSSWNRIAVPLNVFLDKNHTYVTADGKPRYFSKEAPYVKYWYRRNFNLPEDMRDKRVLLHFGVIGYEGRIFINGNDVGNAHGDFVPTSFDITGYVRPGNNTVAVRVFTDFRPFQKNPQQGEPYYRTYGARYWYKSIKGGLWQSVSLTVEPKIRFDNVLIASDFAKKELEIRCTVFNHTEKDVELDLTSAVTDAEEKNANYLDSLRAQGTHKLRPGRNSLRFTHRLNAVKPWAPTDAHLYFLTLFLKHGAGNAVSACTERFGFREMKSRGTAFELNGKHIFLAGENIHSSFYGGLGLAKELEKKKLIEEMTSRLSAGVVMLRTIHMPPDKLMIDTADEIGMMIFDEWGFAFRIPQIDEQRFEKTNLNELSRFIERDFNAPSVCMWSLGNEVHHNNQPDIARQLNKQLELVHRIDFQKRPASAFSGAGSIDAYGAYKFDGDCIDLHTYHGVTDRPWTEFRSLLDARYMDNCKVYADGKPLNVPFVIWECIGYGWGQFYDPEFKVGSVEDYEKYVKTPFTWTLPKGIGWSGHIGLAKMLDRNLGSNYAMDRQCARIVDMMRQDSRVQGIGPSIMPLDMPQATRIFQKIYPGIRTGENYLPPRNLFTGQVGDWEFFIVNDQPEPLEKAVAVLSFSDGKARDIELLRFELPVLKPGERYTRKVSLTVPEAAGADRPADWQLRTTILDRSGNDLARNFANVIVERKSLLSDSVPTNTRNAVLNLPGADLKFLRALDAWRVPYSLIGEAEMASYQTVIVPPPLKGREIKVDGECLKSYVEQGGVLLFMEQETGSIPGFYQLFCVNDRTPFADLVLPDHPIFKNMRREQFDLWSSEPNGNLAHVMISPFTKNALAAKLPLLVRTTTGTLVLEAKVGKGRLLASQLLACSLYDSESAAARYLRNLIEYACNRPLASPARELEISVKLTYDADQENLRSIPLEKYANRGFSSTEGWFGQGGNGFSMMPKGKISAAGITFELIDPANNNGNGCLMIRGEETPFLPEKISGIKIGGKFSRLFFLHTAGFCRPNPSGRYRMHYEDGTVADLELVGRKNIGDWWIGPKLPEALPGFSRVNFAGKEIGWYVAAWNNPHPEKQIVSMDFISAIRGGDGVDYIKTDSPTPVLAAVTGETAATARATIFSGNEKNPESRWSCLAWRGGEKPSCEVVPAGADAPRPFALKIHMPENVGKGVPAVFTRTPECSDAKRLVFWIKTENPGVVELVLLGKDAKKGAREALMCLPEPGKWIKISLDWKNDLKGRLVDLKDAKQELFLYNGLNPKVLHPRPAVTFLMTGVQWE